MIRAKIKQAEEDSICFLAVTKWWLTSIYLFVYHKIIPTSLTAIKQVDSSLTHLLMD